MVAIKNTPENITIDQFMLDAVTGIATGKKLAVAAVITYPRAKMLIGMPNLPSEKRAGGKAGPPMRRCKMHPMDKA